MVLERLSFASVLVLSILCGFIAGFGFLTIASQHQTARGSYQPPISQPSISQPSIFESVSALNGTPAEGQESIDQAMAKFAIKLPGNARWPQFDGELQDRGLTVKSRWFEKSTVTIGRSAFSSWAMLGSTLAHEIEVHCQQNFPLIFLEDKLGLKGSLNAEREAYEHEIKNAGRFGLSVRDTRLIAATMEYYYPAGK